MVAIFELATHISAQPRQVFEASLDVVLRRYMARLIRTRNQHLKALLEGTNGGLSAHQLVDRARDEGQG